MNAPSELKFEQEIAITSTPDALWQALIDPARVRLYHLAPLAKLDLQKGGDILYGTPEEILISGSIVDFETEVRLVHSFRFGPEHSRNPHRDPDTLVTYKIKATGEGSVLKILHTGFTEDNQTWANISGGWPHILAQLKAYLEEKSAS